jgi:hypothetical protein
MRSRGRLDVPWEGCNHTVRPNLPIEDDLVRTRRFLPLMLLALLLLAPLSGCQKDEEIKSYDVPHPEREKIRLLAAILPHGEHTWFVRLSGPEAEIAEQKKTFDAFVGSIRFDDNAKPPIQWTAPESWKEQGGSAMATLVFRVDADPHPLQATLSHFGKFGEGANTVADNVNRWRKQINLPPAEGAELDQLARHLGEAYVVDMTGIGVAKKAARPMAPAEHPPLDHPAIGAAGPAKKGLPFRFEVPQGWQPSAGGQFSSIGYDITEGSARARVTITGLAGDGGGILFNLKRWRQDKGQAALPPIPDADIARQAQALPIAGVQATYADFSGKDVRILGIILPLREKAWFIKMTGPPELVGRQKSNFEAFVKSLRLETE